MLLVVIHRCMTMPCLFIFVCFDGKGVVNAIHFFPFLVSPVFTFCVLWVENAT